VDPLKNLLSQAEVAFRQEDIAQVDLRIGDRFVVAPLMGSFGPLPVEVEGSVQVSNLDVQPSHGVQEALPVHLVAYLLRERQSLLEDAQASVIVTLSGEGEPVTEEIYEKRYQKVVFPSNL
jgi:hypothetical protein